MSSITTTPSPSPTFSQDFDCWQEVDRITEQYRVAIQNEEKYINERVFAVDNSMYKIITGFSAARNYIPAVRILMTANELVDKTNHISFNEEEWRDCISYLNEFSNSYFDIDAANADGGLEDEEGYEVQFSNFSISKSPLLGVRMLKMTNGFTTFYLSGNTVREFIKMNELIKSNMCVLQYLDFAGFYNNFLNVTSNIMCDSNYDMPLENVMLTLCDLLPCSIQTYCIRECLFFNKNNVMNDLDRKMFY